MRRFAAGCALVAAVVAVGGARAEKLTLVQGTQGAKIGAWEVQTGGLVLPEGAAGCAFGTVRKGTPAQQFSYFVVLKHGYGPCSKTDSSEEVGTENKLANTKQVVGVNGHKLTVAYQIEFDARAKMVLRETITVNGKAVDAAKGRVLLVDLTVTPPKWEQKNVELPPLGATAPTEKKAAEALGRKTLEALAKQDKGVRAFIGAAKE